MATKIKRMGNSDHTKIKLYQKKVLLEFLGVDSRDVPGNSSELDVLIEAASKENPAAYQVGFDVVVNKKLPEDDQENKMLMDWRNLSDIIDKTIGKYEAEALAAITTRAISTVDGLDGKFSLLAKELASHIKQTYEDAAREAAEQYRRVEYVVTNSEGKINKIEGPMPENFQDILDLADSRVNIMLVGPSGCGKTHTAEQVAKALGMDFAGQSCSAGMSESIFAGWLLPVEKAGQFVYVSSEFVRLYENGGVFLFDEIDASDSNTLLFLNQALANGSFYLPQRYEKPKVTKHKDFVAIAAANTYGTGATAMYSGRNSLDAATMDRFRMGIVEMDYSPAVETALVDAEVLEFGKAVREVIGRHKMRKIMSTRLMLDATKMVRNKKWPIERVAKSYFSDWSAEEMKIANTSAYFLKRKNEASLKSMENA